MENNRNKHARRILEMLRAGLDQVSQEINRLAETPEEAVDLVVAMFQELAEAGEILLTISPIWEEGDPEPEGSEGPGEWGIPYRKWRTVSFIANSPAGVMVTGRLEDAMVASGMSFDSGSGGGRDLELDWSFSYRPTGGTKG